MKACRDRLAFGVVVSVAALLLAACGLEFVGSSAPDDASVVPSPNADARVTNNNDAIAPSPSDDAATTSDGSNDGDLPSSVCTLDAGGSGILCGATCINPSTDRTNCGGCGKVCAPWAACEGTCVDVAKALVAVRHEIACTNENTPCSIVTASPPDKKVVLTGTPGNAYSLAVRIRGVVEQKTYTNSSVGPATGNAGALSNPSFFAQGGTVVGGDNWNLYDLLISTPAWTWHLNSGTSGNTYSDPIDYTARIKANAGATLTLHANSYDLAQAKNRTSADQPIVIPGIPPAPDYFHGQFVQLDIVSVTLTP